MPGSTRTPPESGLGVRGESSFRSAAFVRKAIVSSASDRAGGHYSVDNQPARQSRQIRRPANSPFDPGSRL